MATGGAGRDGIVGAGGIREGIFGGFELVQRQASKACKRVTEQQKKRWLGEYCYYLCILILTHLLGIVLTNAQCNIFEEVKAFVMENRAVLLLLQERRNCRCQTYFL